MHKQAWVKNVYTLRTTHSKKGDHSSPTLTHSPVIPQSPVHKHLLSHLLSNIFTTNLPTYKIVKLPPLLISFTHFPQPLLLQGQKEI